MKTDVFYALRSLRRAPVFFVLAVATLGLGIAANTAIFSLFYQVLLRSLPVRQPEQLVLFHADDPNIPGNASSDNSETVFSYPMYLRMRDSRSLSGLTARSAAGAQMMIKGTAERGSIEVVTGNFFDVLGVRAAAGRLLTASDDTVRGGNSVVVLSHDFWMTRFGGSTSVINQTLLINGQPFQMIGVAPENFRGILSGESPNIYMPVSMRAAITPGWDDFDKPDSRWLTVLGRLAPGVSRERAVAELQPLYKSAVRDHLQQTKVRSQSGRDRILAKNLELHSASRGLNMFEREWRKPLVVLLSMVLLLLLIGCANLANLLMARAVNRAREISIRFALGATRTRIAGMLLTESLLLGLMGTLCGLLLTPFLTNGIIRLMPISALNGWLTGELNLPILGFSIGLMLTATVLFGLAPALQATRGASSPLAERTQSSSGGMVHAQSRKFLVASQVALSVILLATAGMFGRSLARLMAHQPGFRADHLLTFAVNAGYGGYDTERGMTLYRQLERQLIALPGVTSAAMAFTAPLSHSESSSNVTVEGYVEREGENMDSDHNAIGANYFRTLGTRLLAGREFNERDRPGSPKVAIVNQAFVKRFFGGREAMGRKMKIGSGQPLDIEIVGVVADANNLDFKEIVKPTFYIPFEQYLTPSPRIMRAAFMVRSDRGFETLSRAIRTTMARLDASLPVGTIRPMEQNVEDSMYTDRLVAALSTAFGMLALVLTAVGLYGVIAYVVSRRTGEIGIRMVLGAAPISILGMILREVALLLAIGGTVGALGAILAGRAIESQLFDMRGFDPVVLFGSIAVLTFVAMSAACVPAIRAARVQPLDALRHD